MTGREFAQHKFDVLVLLFVLILQSIGLYFFRGGDARFIDFFLVSLGNVNGALLMALQAGRNARRSTDKGEQ